MDRELSRRIAEKQAYNDFGTALSGDYQELCNVELEFGCSRGGLPTEELTRAINAFSKHLGVHLYYTIAGEVIDDKPHHHLILLCNPADSIKIFFRLGIEKEDFSKSTRKGTFRWFLRQRAISIAHRTDAAGLLYKFSYLQKHEALIPFNCACPRRANSCRRRIKRSGKCSHHLTEI